MNYESTNIHERTQLLLGADKLNSLSQRHVLIAGIGGVGSFAAEALARAGILNITLVDHDRVDPTNINRQLLALHSTSGQQKTAVMAARIKDINPNINLTLVEDFITSDNIKTQLQTAPYDFVIDCIDSIACKAAMVVTAQQFKMPVISAMGAGGRLDVTKVLVSSLNETHTCPLAKAMRRSVKILDGNLNYPVVFSTEVPKKGSSHQAVFQDGKAAKSRSVNGTISYLPGLFGLMMAGHVIQEML